jgi:hypothetical protein
MLDEVSAAFEADENSLDAHTMVEPSVMPDGTDPDIAEYVSKSAKKGDQSTDVNFSKATVAKPTISRTNTMFSGKRK